MNSEIMLASSSAAVPASYHAELSSDLLDADGQLIDLVVYFAFETLGASHLDLRVSPSSRFQGQPFEPHTRTQR